MFKLLKRGWITYFSSKALLCRRVLDILNVSTGVGWVSLGFTLTALSKLLGI